MNFKLLLKIFVAFSLTLPGGFASAAAPVAETEGGAGDEKKCNEKSSCGTAFAGCKQEAGKADGAQNAMGAGLESGDVDTGASGTLATAQSGVANCSAMEGAYQKAKDQCECAIKACEKNTDPKNDPKKLADAKDLLEKVSGSLQSSSTCKDGAQKAADNAKGDGSGKGGGMDPMMAGLIGAGIGAGLMYLMNKKKTEEEEGVGADGTYDCSHPEAYQYADCDEFLSKSCYAAEVAGTAPTDACKNFAGRYCNMNNAGITEDTPTTIETGETSLGVTKGGNGKGITTDFCKYVVAKDFCNKQAPQVKLSCPSCIMLENAKIAACAANPLMCFPQHSQADIAVAKNTCGSDPAFLDARYTAGGGAAVPSQLVNEGLPVVVLPTGTAPTDTAADVTVTDPNAPGVILPNGTTVSSVNGAAAGMKASSVGGATAAAGGGLNREGLSNANGSATSTGGGGMGGGASGSSAVAGFSDRVAGNSRGAGASAQRSPASDVGQQYGSTLFKISADAISNSCAATRTNCRSN